MQSQLPVRKSKEEIEFYIKHGQIFGNILFNLYNLISSGNVTNGLELEQKFLLLVNNVSSLWRQASFPFVTQTNYIGDKFENTICVSINDTVAHAKPNSNNFKDKDIISVDCGLALPFKNRLLHFDSAFTAMYNHKALDWIIKPYEALVNLEQKQVQTTYRAAEVIYKTALQNKLDVIVLLTGHGIGYSLHEEPNIRNAPGRYPNVSFFNGLCFCAEPIFVLPEEKREVSYLTKAYIDSDGWSVKTINSQPSSHFETMFCILNNNLVDICGITKWFC